MPAWICPAQAMFDGAYATMAIPTMLSTFVLAPKVKSAAQDYFRRHDAGEFRQGPGHEIEKGSV